MKRTVTEICATHHGHEPSHVTQIEGELSPTGR